MLFNQAGYALNSMLTGALSEVGISVKVYCVLKKAIDGDYTQSQLSELAWMDKSTIVNVLDEMERDGLAVRRFSPTDRRVRLVSVTAKGRARLARAEVVVEATYEKVLGALPASQRSVFVAALARLVEGPLASPFHMEEQLRRPARRPR
ncbi:MAG: winged helix-turn-helix transcriptional regulator [Streptomyces sp.]|uniref:MarR family winged helix-turn-helix transcriptional regulator n=1 Tax=Streptomyces sp. TaxID=1931 RepID=UPI0025F70379|nr:MarR family winged helix-turn-helix transcriptional regulator [Streptomyces sp.]MBW8801558.1 winged helix-turn-helix transcriptional regulator [Streptomyces sp.]